MKSKTFRVVPFDQKFVGAGKASNAQAKLITFNISYKCANNRKILFFMK